MTDRFTRNLLCYGDNLALLSDVDLFPDASVDFMYLDPPFNSQHRHNVPFRDKACRRNAERTLSWFGNWRRLMFRWDRGIVICSECFSV